MSKRTIRWVIILGVLAIGGIIFSQVFWIRKGLIINQNNFEDAVTVTLENIAEKIEIDNRGLKVTEHPVVRISPHSYLVNISEKIDLNKLDYYLRSEFTNPFHKIDFRYEVYDRSHNDEVFELDVPGKTQPLDFKPANTLPVLTGSRYYFKVNFPRRPIVTSVMLFVWITALVTLTVVLAFFVYSFNVIVRQQRLSEFQKSFINNLAHEFKTPISTIGISAEVLREKDISEHPARLSSYAGIVTSEVGRLSNQVNKILELAKIETDELIVDKEDFDINACVREISDAFALKVHERQGVLTTVLGADYTTLCADQVHFANVLNTLLDNALKYNSGQPEITITTSNDEKHIFLSVQDNGMGIPKEYRKKIFEKFFRIPTGNVHNVKGYGLGLNYVQMIANAHHWKLKVDSEMGKGSIFTITFPIIRRRNANRKKD